MTFYPRAKVLANSVLGNVGLYSALQANKQTTRSHSMCRPIPGPYVRESGFQDPGNFLLWNLESWALESGIQLKKSGTPLTIAMWKGIFGVRDLTKYVCTLGIVRSSAKTMKKGRDTGFSWKRSGNAQSAPLPPTRPCLKGPRIPKRILKVS